ncbi:MAG: Rieske (2Fe-2S) protein [Ignavibacteria bacterium]|nr:Rieske (2Fe-2S) protein [Ignavibacteria bacterium]
MIENDGYFNICKESDLVENKGKRFIFNDIEIAVFKYNNKIYALNNFCPHQLSSVLYKGFIEDGFITCPLHGWQFNLADGFIKGGKNGVKSYDVKIENGNVFINITEKKYSW